MIAYLFLFHMVHWSFILGQAWLLSKHFCKACQNCLRPNFVIAHKAPLRNAAFLNPILTGLFESKFLLGGGGGGGVNLTPPSDLGPEGADRREILHGCQDTCKEYCYNLFSAENGLFIMLL